MVQVAIPVQAVGVQKNKKRQTRRVTVYFTHMGIGEPTPLNRLLSFFAHHAILPLQWGGVQKSHVPIGKRSRPQHCISDGSNALL
jgi:hypothetical protein